MWLINKTDYQDKIEVINPDGYDLDLTYQFDNLTWSKLNISPITRRDLFIEQTTLPIGEDKYIIFDNSTNKFRKMTASEKTYKDAKDIYEAMKIEFHNKRYHVFVDFTYLNSIPDYAVFISWCTGRSLDPIDSIISYIDNAGLSHVFCNTFAPGHGAIIDNDPHFTKVDVESYNPDVS